MSNSLRQAIERCRIPGAATATYADHSVNLDIAGFADAVEEVPVTADTLFQIGSITKVFTATLVCKLHEEGLVDLDAPVSRYMPDLRIQGARPPETMTVRTLLDYSSGVEGQYFEDFGSDDDALEKYVDACVELRIIHTPGDMRAYNSTSYCIAGRLIELVTGESYDAALASRLLEPIGIRDYSFYDVDNLPSNAALGHSWNDETEAFVVDDVLRLPRSMSPAGSSLSLTATGLLDFARMHLNDGIASNGKRYMEADTVKTMRVSTRTVPPNDSELLLGWAALPLNNGRLTIASGRTIGQNAFVMFAPEHDFAMAILTNSAMGGEQLFHELGLADIERHVGTRPQMPVPPSGDVPEDIDPSLYVGTYANPAEVSVVDSEGSLQMVARYRDNATEKQVSYTSDMHPAGRHRFALKIAGTDQPSGTAQFMFENADGEVASHVFTSGCVFGRRSCTGR